MLTKNNEFLVAAVRQVLYVWDARDGDLVKVLNVHFGRIISLDAVTGHRLNKLISASIDKTIKVWNLDKILEDVHHIDRLEKPVDAVSVAADGEEGGIAGSLALTTTRGCIGIWNMENGRLIQRLTNGSHSIVTHAVVTRDGAHLISAESGNLVLWDIGTGKVVDVIDKQPDVLQMMLIDNDSKVNQWSVLTVCVLTMLRFSSMLIHTT